jgi:hypothetical protein
MATWIWTLCYAIDMKLLLGNKNGSFICYHILAWVFPAVLTMIGLIILYIPDAKSGFTNIVITCICIFKDADDNKCKMILQLSWLNVVI